MGNRCGMLRSGGLKSSLAQPPVGSTMKRLNLRVKPLHKKVKPLHGEVKRLNRQPSENVRKRLQEWSYERLYSAQAQVFAVKIAISTDSTHRLRGCHFLE
jgi:hypothetical protein